MVVFQIFVPQKVCDCQVGLQCLFSDSFPRVYVFHRAACNAKVRTRHALFSFFFFGQSYSWTSPQQENHLGERRKWQQESICELSTSGRCREVAACGCSTVLLDCAIISLVAHVLTSYICYSTNVARCCSIWRISPARKLRYCISFKSCERELESAVYQFVDWNRTHLYFVLLCSATFQRVGAPISTLNFATETIKPFVTHQLMSSKGNSRKYKCFSFRTESPLYDLSPLGSAR